MFSSVGLERYLERVEVTGSNPVTPTKKIKSRCITASAFFWEISGVLFKLFKKIPQKTTVVGTTEVVINKRELISFYNLNLYGTDKKLLFSISLHTNARMCLVFRLF